MFYCHLASFSAVTGPHSRARIQQSKNSVFVNLLCGWKVLPKLHFTPSGNASKATAADERCHMCHCPDFLPGLCPLVAVTLACCALIGLYFLSTGNLPSWSPAKDQLEQTVALLPTQPFVNGTRGDAFRGGASSLPLCHMPPLEHLMLPGKPADPQPYIITLQPVGALPCSSRWTATWGKAMESWKSTDFTERSALTPLQRLYSNAEVICQPHITADAQVPFAFAMWACPKCAPLGAGTGNSSSSPGGLVHGPGPVAASPVWCPRAMSGRMQIESLAFAASADLYSLRGCFENVAYHVQHSKCSE